MSTKHTPGPWHIPPIPMSDEGWKIVSEPGTNPCDDDPAGMEWIATAYDGDCRKPGPNARLIAAAPDLLAACKKADCFAHCACGWCGASESSGQKHGANCPVHRIRAAVAKMETPTEPQEAPVES